EAVGRRPLARREDLLQQLVELTPRRGHGGESEHAGDDDRRLEADRRLQSLARPLGARELAQRGDHDGIGGEIVHRAGKGGVLRVANVSPLRPSATASAMAWLETPRGARTAKAFFMGGSLTKAVFTAKRC